MPLKIEIDIAEAKEMIAAQAQYQVRFGLQAD
jgi:hypothetical protein